MGITLRYTAQSSLQSATKPVTPIAYTADMLLKSALIGTHAFHNTVGAIVEDLRADGALVKIIREHALVAGPVVDVRVIKVRDEVKQTVTLEQHGPRLFVRTR